MVDIADLVGDAGIIMSRKNDQKRGSGGLVRQYLDAGYSFTAELLDGRLSRAMRNTVDQYELLRGFRLRDVTSEMKLAAIQTLKDRGLVLVNDVYNPEDRKRHTLHYSFFVGKNAEPLRLHTEKGSEIRISPNKSNLRGVSKVIRHILAPFLEPINYRFSEFGLVR